MYLITPSVPLFSSPLRYEEKRGKEWFSGDTPDGATITRCGAAPQ
jgi:hypothetical protein